MRRTRPCTLVAALLLAACQSAAPPPSGAGAAPPPPSANGDDACRSRDYAWLVGKDRKQVPAAPEDKVIRVVCSTCPMTMDYNAQRLNVVFDEKTGIVQKLSCG